MKDISNPKATPSMLITYLHISKDNPDYVFDPIKHEFSINAIHYSRVNV